MRIGIFRGGLPFGYNVLYLDVSVGLVKQDDVEPVRVIHYIGKLKPWMISIRAIYRRSKHNFLGKYLWRYAMLIYLIRIKLWTRGLGHNLPAHYILTLTPYTHTSLLNGTT